MTRRGLGQRAMAAGWVAMTMAACGPSAPSAGPPTPISASPTSVINLPPGALDTATPTRTPTPTPSDTPTPTFTPTPPCVAKAQFIEDVTIPDGTPLSPGSRVIKVWRIRNTGTCAWDGEHRLVQVPGSSLRADDPDAELPHVAPGDSVDIGVPVELSLEAPVDQEQIAVFELRDPDGQRFARLTMKIKVVAGTPAAPAEPTLSVGEGSLGGTVWSDFCHPGGQASGPAKGDCVNTGGGGQQADGVRQSAEPGIAGIVVNLSAGSCPGGSIIASRITDASGRYLFTDLGPGSYCVWVDSLDLVNGPILVPGAWSATPGVAADNSGKALATAVVLAGEKGAEINFGWDYQFD